MSPRHTQIAIMGGGLAGHTAARAVHQAGADAVMICPSSPGATALWGGLGQVFGPADDFPSRSVGLFGQSATLPTNLRQTRADRFFALTHRRQFHPYQRLGLAQDAIADTASQAIELLGYSGITNLANEIVYPSAAGAPLSPISRRPRSATRPFGAAIAAAAAPARRPPTGTRSHPVARPIP